MVIIYALKTKSSKILFFFRIKWSDSCRKAWRSIYYILGVYQSMFMKIIEKYLDWSQDKIVNEILFWSNYK